MRERHFRGKIQCQLILQFPDIRTRFGLSATSYRKSRTKIFWMMPGMFRLIATVFAFLADCRSARLVPTWTVYPPMAIAFWDGIHSVAPRYQQLQAVLLESGENLHRRSATADHPAAFSFIRAVCLISVTIFRSK
jgi:hypothetical protein